jgi:tetratricopeptide (TPR) repeat protein
LAKEKTLRREPLEEVRKEENMEVQDKPARTHKRKLLTGGIVIGILLVIAAILVYPKIFKRDTLEKMRISGERISIAVMPFRNMTNDTLWNVWQSGIQEIMTASLSNSEELKVRQTEPVKSLIQNKGYTNYASVTPSVAITISQKLDANVFVYGNIIQAGKTIRLNAQLYDSKTGEVIKPFQIEGPANEENILHISDSLSTQVRDFLVITKLKKEVPPEVRQMGGTTKSPEAYRYYINGCNAFSKRDYPAARNMFFQALAIDSNFIDVVLMLPFAFRNEGFGKEGRYWAIKVYEKRDKMTLHQKIWANYIHAAWFESPYERIKCLKQYLEEVDDQDAAMYWQLGAEYSGLPQYDKVIFEMEKSLDIYHKWGTKPFWVYNYTALGYAYRKTGQYGKEKKLYEKAEQDFPNDPDLIYNQAILSLVEKDTIQANQYIQRLESVLKENTRSEADILTSLAWIYAEAGIPDKAEEYFRKALSLEPENSWKLFDLSWFLIDKDRNIIEGLAFVEKALEKNPDNYDYLHAKGWGLYKQCKYKEALEILQKSWDLRMEKDQYGHEAFLHLEAAKKAVAQKQ